MLDRYRVSANTLASFEDTPGGPMTKTTARRLIIAVAMTVALLGAGCTSESADTTTTTAAFVLPPADSLPDLEFGRGELPITVPPSWPLPPQHSIAATMIDGARTLTEVVYTMGGTVDEMVDFYDTSLASAGYEAEFVADSDTQTTVTFSGNGIEGELVIKGLGPGVSGATLRFTYA